MAQPRLHLGEISLKLGGRVILYEDAVPIDARLMREGEPIGIGDEIFFPVLEGGCWGLGVDSLGATGGRRVVGAE